MIIKAICSECGQALSFKTRKKSYDFVCCGKAQTAGVPKYEGEDSVLVVPPKVDIPNLKDQDGDGDVDQDDVNVILEKAKNA